MPVLTACDGIFEPGPPPITEGNVVDREFIPEHWESGYRTEHYTDCGFHYDYYEGDYTYGCEPATRQVYESHHRWEPDTWRIQIDGCVEYERDEETLQHCDTRWLDVSEDEYNRFRVGIHYPNPA